MPTEPDLSLPDRIPEVERYQHTPQRLLPFALYTLDNLDDETFEKYRLLCTTDCGNDDVVKLPPRARFVGSPLQSIIDYHLELGNGDEFDPTLFLVCVYAKSTSVIAVTLDEDLNCKPDLLWIKMEEAGLLLVNLQIGNTDWAEAKEDDLEGPTWPDGDDGSKPGENDEFAKPTNKPDSEDDQPSNDYGPPPPLGFHIQVYALSDIDHDKLIRDLEPGSYKKKPDQSDWACKLHKLPKDAARDPVRYATNLHPLQCSKHPTLEKKYFIVADEPNFADEGVAIVQIDWDGNTAGRTRDQLREFGESLMYQVQRAEVPDTAHRAAVGTVCMLAQGYEKWHPKVKQFAIYYPNTSDADIKLAVAVDPRWTKRGHGEARVALGGSMQDSEIQRGGGFWPALIRRHVAFCKREKFVPSFVRQYFVYCEVQEPKTSTKVQLIKLDWNGDLRLVDTLASEYQSKATCVEVHASEAHKTLTKLVDGEVEWDGEAIAPS